MHLHDHFGFALLEVNACLHGNHRELDQIGCSALHGGIDGSTLCASTPRSIGRVDFWQIQTTAKHGFHVALRFGLLACFVHVALHTCKTLEVALDVIFGSAVVDAQGFGQTKCTHAINQTEVDGFGIAALLTRHLIGR